MSAPRAMSPDEYFEREAERLALAPMPGSRPLRHIPAARRVNMDATPVLLDRRAVELAAHARGMSKIPTTTADITLAQAQGRAEVPRWKAESLAVLLGVDVATLTTPPPAGIEPAEPEGATMPESKKYPCPIRGCTFGSDKPNGLKIHIGRAHKALGDAALQRAEKVIRAIDTAAAAEQIEAVEAARVAAEAPQSPSEAATAATGELLESTRAAVEDAFHDANDDDDRCHGDCAEEPCEGHCYDPEHAAAVAEAERIEYLKTAQDAPSKTAKVAVRVDLTGLDEYRAMRLELVDAKLELVTMLLVDGSFEESERIVDDLDRVRELVREMASAPR